MVETDEKTPQPDDLGTCYFCGADVRREGWERHWQKQHPDATVPVFPENPVVVVPRFCDRHAHDLVVQRLRIPESGPWLAALVTAQILHFAWASLDPRVIARSEGDTRNLSLVFAEIGCLACYDRDGYRRIFSLIRKVGLPTAAKIARSELTHPDWPIQERAEASRQ